ncbi:MAG TPA: cytochrome c biogenesis CcdA family protein [Pseudonocardiaceae bacterium]|nr:cytochrome c biogenesis CcdA family protein [Pseudonocardiaceae bacterium]
MLDIGYLAAFLGGLLALISPCSALLLPSFFAYAFAGTTELLARTGVFFLGLAAVLVPLGAGSSALASVVTLHREVLILLAGWMIVGFGVIQILGGGWTLRPAARVQQRMAAGGSWVCTVGLGAAYGLAGFCSGPILGAVLTVAAASGQPLRGAALLAVYALGMAAPLFVLAALWQRFDLGRRRWLRGREYRIGGLRLHTTSTVSGLLFIAVGVVFLLFDGTAGLYSTGTGTTLAVQNVIIVAGAHVPDSILLSALAAVVLIVVALRLRRRQHHGT